MITTIITDFDGTLVDTFEANLRAYRRAFADNGLHLTAEEYRQRFGYRFERFMTSMGITDEKMVNAIKEAKKYYYPQFFEYMKPNKPLIELISGFKSLGGKTAIASTARKENLMNAVGYLGIAGIFNSIFAGMDVKEGKPSPEIYLKAMAALDSKPEESLIFEDSEVGIQAARASGAHYMIVDQKQFDKHANE